VAIIFEKRRGGKSLQRKERKGGGERKEGRKKGILYHFFSVFSFPCPQRSRKERKKGIQRKGGEKREISQSPNIFKNSTIGLPIGHTRKREETQGRRKKKALYNL